MSYRLDSYVDKLFIVIFTLATIVILINLVYVLILDRVLKDIPVIWTDVFKNIANVVCHHITSSYKPVKIMAAVLVPSIMD